MQAPSQQLLISDSENRSLHGQQKLQNLILGDMFIDILTTFSYRQHQEGEIYVM